MSGGSRHRPSRFDADATGNPGCKSDIAGDASAPGVESPRLCLSGATVLCERLYDTLTIDDPLVRVWALEVFLAMTAGRQPPDGNLWRASSVCLRTAHTN
jgi:hypothetical protein